jgi:hypothetical protein
VQTVDFCLQLVTCGLGLPSCFVCVSYCIVCKGMVLTKRVSLKRVIAQGMNVRRVHDEGMSVIRNEAEGMSDHNVRIRGRGFEIFLGRWGVFDSG